MFDEEGIWYDYRYTISYFGSIFSTDKDNDWNFIHTDKWDDCVELIHEFGDDPVMGLAVEDKITGMMFSNGEWV